MARYGPTRRNILVKQAAEKFVKVKVKKCHLQPMKTYSDGGKCCSMNQNLYLPF